MKYLYLFILLLLLSVQVTPCKADEAADSSLIITNEKREDGKKAVKAVFILKVDPEQVYRTLLDVERFTEFMPGSAEVEILENDPGYQVVKFSGRRGLLSGDVIMKRNIDDKNRRIEWNLVDGPPREVSGYWYVEKASKRENETVVYYLNYIDAGTLIPGFLVRKYIYSDIKKMVPNIIKRVESDGTWISDEYLKKINKK